VPIKLRQCEAAHNSGADCARAWAESRARSVGWGVVLSFTGSNPEEGDDR